MSTTTGTDPAEHPIVAFTARLHAVMNTLNEVPGWSMTDAEKRQVLVSLTKARGRVEELRLRVLAAADRADVAAESAATSTGAWLAAATVVPVRDAHRDVKLARALDEGFAATRDGLAAGRVDVEQARVVVASVQGLPAAAVAVDPSLAGRAEKHLLILAEGTDGSRDTGSDASDDSDIDSDGSSDGSDGSDGGGPGRAAGEVVGRCSGLDAVKLKQVGRHLFHVLDPDAADVELGRRLDAEERAAARRTFFSMFDNGDGTHSGRFKISDLHAAMIRKALEAITAPRQQHQTRQPDTASQSAQPTAQPTDQPTDQAGDQAGDQVGDQAGDQAGDGSRDQSGDQSGAGSRDQSCHQAGDGSSGQSSHQAGDRSSGRDGHESKDETSDHAHHHSGDDHPGDQASDKADDPAGDPASDQADDRANHPPSDQVDDPADDRVARAKAARPEIMGKAFCRLLERITAQHLPQAGGMSSTVVVLLDYDRLLSGLGTARLDTGEVISAGAARRMACESGIVPAVYRKVLGGRSVVLDVGRRRRFHTETQRMALTIQDQGCAAENCDRPPAWTETHHPVAWADGGVTSVENGRLLCGHHHHKAHSPAYDMHRLPNGKVRFHKRT